MAAFPLLKTGAVAQYPLRRRSTYATEVLQFIDGSEQRFRQYQAPVRSWTIRLDALDETEAAEIERFFESHGSNTTFSFTDPADGKTYPSCSVDQDEFERVMDVDMRTQVEIVIRENRS
jgi:phage-related protein